MCYENGVHGRFDEGTGGVEDQRVDGEVMGDTPPDRE